MTCVNGTLLYRLAQPVAIVGGDTAAELESRLAKISEEKANLEVELDMSKKKFMAVRAQWPLQCLAPSR